MTNEAGNAKRAFSVVFCRFAQYNKGTGIAMMKALEILLRGIQNGTLLGSATFTKINAGDILTGRDGFEFEDEWIKLFNRIEAENLSESDAVVVNQIREIAFKTAFQHCSDPDLSGYISDDFELISRGATEEINDHFLNALLEAYVDGRVPHEKAQGVGKSLRMLLDTISSAVSGRE